MNPHDCLRYIVCAAALAASSFVAHAGRPFVVDDANVDAPGTGHVEAWYAREPGRNHTWNVAPAYGLIESIELGAAFSHDTTEKLTTSSVQIKWRMTPPTTNSCNLAAVAGVSRTQPSQDTPYINTIMTCNDAEKGGAMHLNVGRKRPSGGPNITTWGLGFELPPSGRFVGTAEAFGQRDDTPTTYQFGLRTNIGTQWQVDGTVGRTTAKETLYSIGLKYSY